MSNMRITGMASGFDTDAMIKSLMKAENSRMDKVKKNKQSVKWQQEAFRDITKQLRTLQSSFFDILKPGNNISSATSFSKFSYSVTSGGVASSAVSITASSASTAKSVTIDRIDALATKDTLTGAVGDLKGIKTDVVNIEQLKTDLAGGDLEFTLAIGTSSKVISVSNAELTSLSGSADLAALLNTKIGSAFGADFSNVVSESAGVLKFDMKASTVKILEYDGNTAALSSLGLTSGESNMDYRTKAISEVFGFTELDLTGLKINGKDVSLATTDTVDQMVEKINKSGAGVTMSYNSMTDQFKLQSTQDGSANAIDLTNSSDAFLSKLFNVSSTSQIGVNPADGSSKQAAQNARLVINGESIVQGSNNFTLDGINFSLKSESATAINIGVSVNTADIVTNIKNFVTEYNKIMDTINTELSEKKNYDFKPLTDEEKDAMTEKEIELWEEKAKAGILRGSSELSTFATSIRNALVDTIEGSGLSLSQIGISSTSYLDKGKLTVNEDQLKQSLETNYDEVVKLFTAKSDANYGDTTRVSERYRENGIGSRIDDILKDYVRTTRDSNGKKGILIEKAGIDNDVSNTINEISKKLTEYDDRIADLVEFLADKENYYYNMFSKMESALNKMNAQQSSLAGMMGSSS